MTARGTLRWASVRYWDCEPTEGWQQLSEAFGIGLLTLAYVTYDTAQNGDEARGTCRGVPSAATA